MRWSGPLESAALLVSNGYDATRLLVVSGPSVTLPWLMNVPEVVKVPPFRIVKLPPVVLAARFLSASTPD